MFLRNVGILPNHYTMSEPTRLRLEFSLPWRHQVSQYFQRILLLLSAFYYLNFCIFW